MRRSDLLLIVVLILNSAALVAQDTNLPDAPHQQNPPPATPKPQEKAGYGKHHILWVIPNYRTDEIALKYEPLPPKQKFKLAFDDSFDPTAFLVAGVFAGSAMAQRQ